MSEPRFRISSEIVHETVDGEVIAIDLGNGSYYSVAGSGPAIWELLGEGASEAQLGEALAERFEAARESIDAEVSRLLGELREHGLVVEAEPDRRAVADSGAAVAEKAPFEAPRLERYTDMKDYFLLDPIHEVNPAAGWPRPAA
jgi:hypothetical protein